MRNLARSFLAVLFLVSCAADPVGTGENPTGGDGYFIHSLGIKLRKSPEPSVIGGMWHGAGGLRRAFFFSGVVDGQSPLKDPIFGHQLPIACLKEGCTEFQFTLSLPDSEVKRVVIAKVYPVISTDTQSDAAIEGDAYQDYRIHWQNLLAKGIDLASSSVVRAQEGETEFLSATLVGNGAPAFHFYFPSEGTPRLAYDYQTHDGGFFGAGHTDGTLTLDGDVAWIRIPGGLLGLGLKK